MSKLKVLFVYTNCMMDNLIPVGVSSLFGALKRIDVEVELFDTTFYKTEEDTSDIDRAKNLQVLTVDYSEAGTFLKQEDFIDSFREHVVKFQPDIIMLSAVEVTFSQGISLLESIREIRPYTVVGGIFATLVPDEVIANDCVDAVCIGEGEDAIAEFCQKYVAEKNFSNVPGMWFKTNGQIIKNPTSHLVDLDAMGFLDFSLYDEKRFYKPMQGRFFRMIPVEFSRGCPYRCKYCANHALEKLFKPVGNWYRWKSMDRIFSEIDHYLKSYNPEFLYFVSESFLSIPSKKFDEFCERYSDYKIPFWFNTRPETITKEILKKLEDINCFRMGIGLEHGSEEFRRTMLGRKVTNDKIVEACKLIEASEITYSVNNMIGFPGESRDLIFDTIKLNRRINPDTVGTFVFTPFKGTELYDYCIEHEYINRKTCAGDLNSSSVLENNILSRDEIKGLLRTFPLYVHFDEEYFALIEKAEQFTEEGNSIFNELANRYIEEHFHSKV